jgi:hypothetical protein
MQKVFHKSFGESYPRCHLPVQPIILESQCDYAMFNDFGAYLSVLPPYRYANTEQLLASLGESIIAPIVKRAADIAERRKEFEKAAQMISDLF